MQLRRQRGQILLIALMIMAVVAMVMAPLLSYIDSSVDLTGKSEDDLKAYYAAEAGVEAVLADLYKGHDPFDTHYPPAESLLEPEGVHSMAISASEMHPLANNAGSPLEVFRGVASLMATAIRNIQSPAGKAEAMFEAVPQVVPSAAAVVTGWHNPSTNAADTGGDGNGFEQNPQNAYGDGSLYAYNTAVMTATATVTTASQSHREARSKV